MNKITPRDFYNLYHNLSVLQDVDKRLSKDKVFQKYIKDFAKTEFKTSSKKITDFIEDNFDIEKSYKTSGSSIWSKKMLKIKTKVENIINKKIKYAQINYYRDGNDYIGWHTDSEVIDGDVIASLSLGVTRKFQFQKINTKAIHNMNLESGTLIIFDHIAAKKEWKHRVPKQPKINDGRINITFRLR